MALKRLKIPNVACSAADNGKDILSESQVRVNGLFDVE